MCLSNVHYIPGQIYNTYLGTTPSLNIISFCTLILYLNDIYIWEHSSATCGTCYNFPPTISQPSKPAGTRKNKRNGWDLSNEEEIARIIHDIGRSIAKLCNCKPCCVRAPGPSRPRLFVCLRPVVSPLPLRTPSQWSAFLRRCAPF